MHIIGTLPCFVLVGVLAFSEEPDDFECGADKRPPEPSLLEMMLKLSLLLGAVVSEAVLLGVSGHFTSSEFVAAGLTLKVILFCIKEAFCAAPDTLVVTLLASVGDMGSLAPELEVNFVLLCTALACKELDKVETLDEVRDTLALERC